MANLIPGQSCVVQTSTDLVNWVCVQTNTVCTASQTVQLPVIPQASTAFYRLMELPEPIAGSLAAAASPSSSPDISHSGS
jgi:hypothetical protein